jgi:putative addiction module killer protein
MIELRKTARFARWLDELRDLQGRARILARIERLASGHPGDVAPVARASLNCASTLVLDTACTSLDAAGL